MTPDERMAIETSLNTMIANAVQLAIAAFAVFYFGRKLLNRLSTRMPPRLRDYVPIRPMPAPVPEMRGNHSSQAQEPPRNTPVPEAAELVPVDRDKPIKLDDLLTELALLSYVDRDGEVKQFSATRIADFIGGRRADTLEAVRVARGEPPPDGIKVKDGAGERVIAR